MVGSMNQGKLEVIKQEMAGVNTDILGIRELKWMGMGKFNSDDHYIQYCGQESLRINAVTLIVKKESLKCSTWVQSQKKQNDVCFQGKPFVITVIQVYAPKTNAKEIEVEWFYENVQNLLELTPKKLSFSLEEPEMQKQEVK